MQGAQTFGMRFADCVWCGLGLQASGLERNFALGILDEYIFVGMPKFDVWILVFGVRRDRIWG